MDYRLLLSALLTVYGSLVLHAQEITFQATVDRNEIAVGEAWKATTAP